MGTTIKGIKRWVRGEGWCCIEKREREKCALLESENDLYSMKTGDD
jgi:hypothetical protein